MNEQEKCYCHHCGNEILEDEEVLLETWSYRTNVFHCSCYEQYCKDMSM